MPLLRRFRRPPPPPRLFWIDALTPARLALMPCPRGDDALDDELRQLGEAGIRHLVSLLPAEEARALGLAEEGARCTAHGLQLHRHAVLDHDVPEDADRFARFVDGLLPAYGAGEGIAIHCRAGIGRSSLTAACLLLPAGHPAASIFPILNRARGLPVPETTEQALWFRDFAARHAPPRD
jgi:protein-tyrosine phosphatase